MTIKEEIIKEAWGSVYNSVKEYLNEHGQIHADNVNFDVFEKVMLMCTYDSNTELLTNSGLQGIENNNGWIAIKSKEDLPKHFIDCFCILKNGNNILANSRGDYFWCGENKWLYNYYDISHYQPISKPKPPLY